MSKPKYRIISTDSELDKAIKPALKSELVVLDEWLMDDGYAVAVYEHELTTGEHDELDLSDKVFDKANNIVRFKRGWHTWEYLSRTTRDGDGQRVWASAKECKDRLESLGKSITNKLVAAANKVNYGDTTSADEAESDAEGKSEEA